MPRFADLETSAPPPSHRSALSPLPPRLHFHRILFFRRGRPRRSSRSSRRRTCTATCSRGTTSAPSPRTTASPASRRASQRSGRRRRTSSSSTRATRSRARRSSSCTRRTPRRGADPMAEAMSAMRYDAMSVGNHEFNFGLAVLRKAQKESSFPWLSSNTRNVADGSAAFPEYLVRTVAGHPHRHPRPHDAEHPELGAGAEPPRPPLGGPRGRGGAPRARPARQGEVRLRRRADPQRPRGGPEDGRARRHRGREPRRGALEGARDRPPPHGPHAPAHPAHAAERRRDDPAGPLGRRPRARGRRRSRSPGRA